MKVKFQPPVRNVGMELEKRATPVPRLTHAPDNAAHPKILPPDFRPVRAACRLQMGG